jgi:hypothetical protein
MDRTRHTRTSSLEPLGSRKALEAYKARKLREAMRVHKARLDVRRREPVPVSR